MTYRYMGDASLYEVVVSIQKEKHGITIQLFRAHTSEPYGELQVPKAHAGRLADLLKEYAGGHSRGAQTPPKDS
tara:strand:- start:1274 stop:1495 length:222 start_codon:yes stop_codon:yes gene_type:complete